MSKAVSTETRLIGYYKKRSATDGADITVQEFLDGIAMGRWRQHVEFVREAIGDKTEYDRRKALSECVTLGGTFTGEKTKENLREPSGLMALDLDFLLDRLESVRRQLSQDPYVYAVFKSIGGQGLCPIFKVDPSRWADSFNGIADYLITTYGLVGKQFDPSSSNINRLRYVSYDPDIHVFDKAKLFTKYPRKEKKQPKPQSFIHTKNDLNYILEQIHAKAVDIAPGYHDWYRMGWALISEYGEEARGYFQEISQYNDGYDADECDKKFNYLVQTRPQQIKIATFYYLCKQAGIDIMTSGTKEVVSVAAMAKKQKITKSSALDMVLKQLPDAIKEEAEPIIDQVYAASDAFDTQETIYQQAARYLQNQHGLSYNEVIRRIEKADGTVIDGKRPLNNIYYELLNLFDGKLRWSDFERIINSDVVPSINPILHFFAANRGLTPVGVIKQLADTIDTDTGWENSEFDPTYAEYFIRKWLIGLVALAHGQLNDIMLILTGPPNSGKTQFFRRLLPDELKRYYAETKLDRDKDDEILMCERLLVMLDELAGRTFHDAPTLKGLLSKDFFTLREPYGSGNVSLQRRATLCGTSNSREVLNDPTGNRRIIPINVLGVNRDAYNAISKTELIMEAYHAFKTGESYSLSQEDIIRLNDTTHGFEKWSIERQLLERYLMKPTGQGGEYIESLQAIDILLYVEQRTNGRKLNEHKIKAELLAMGVKPYQKRLGRDPITHQQRRPYVYDIIKVVE